MKKEIILKDRNVEFLSIKELDVIRGGNSDDKSKSKETDVYDTRDI